MYELYLKECNANAQKPVTSHKYYQIFNYEFNLGFFRPKKDQCERCTAFKNTKNPSMADIESHEKHLSNKQRARQIKDEAKTLSCQGNQSDSPYTPNCAGAFDFEQILNCPHGKSSIFYYKRRLGVFNFTIYDYGNKEVFCYMWPEYEAGRGSTEVASCVYKFLENKKKCQPFIKDIDFFSDNTAAQNRNRFIAFSVWYARKSIVFSSICHTFLEVGHTETENDNVHSVIERKTREIELYTPDQWYGAVRAAFAGRKSGKPYDVIEMTHEDFIDWKTMSKQALQNLLVDDDGVQVYWTNIRQVRVTEKNPDTIEVKTEFDGEWQQITVFRKKKTRKQEYDPVLFLKGMPSLGITLEKKNDLIYLCDSKQIPETYRSYYESLPVRTPAKTDE